MVLGVLGCAAVSCGCIRVTGTFPMSVESAPVTPSPAAVAARPITHGVVGEKLTVGAWTVTVEDAKRTSGKVGGSKPAAGNEFLLVDVGFENKGTDSLEVRPEDFELTDPSGATVPMADVSKPAYNASSMRPLMGRFGTSTVFVYQVPKGSVRYTFAFSPPRVGDKTRLEWRVP
jgi:hypothetical protein